MNKKPTPPATTDDTDDPEDPADTPAKPASNSARSPPTTTARCSKTERDGGEDEADIGRVPVVLPGQAVTSRSAWARSACALRARHHPRHRRNADGARRLAAGPPPAGRRLLDDHVRVRAADPERRHTRTPRTIRVRPRPRLRQQPHRTRTQSTCSDGSSHMQRRRQHTVPHRHHHLDHTTPHPQPPAYDRCSTSTTPATTAAPPTLLPIRRQQRLRLDRIAQRRTRTVRLHHIHIRRRQPRIRQRLPDHPLLRRTVRRGQTVRRTILIHRRPPHHRQHLMPMPPRIRQPLQQDQTHALSPAGTVGIVGERLTPPVRRQPRCRLNSTNIPGVAITATPPASASEHSPERSAWPPGAAPPATTNTPYPPSPPGLRDPARRRPGPT